MTTTARPAPPSTGSGTLLTRGFLLLAAGELAYFVADGIAIYLVPVHATGQLGAGRTGAGLAFGAFALSALLLRPLAGRLCDTVGRRPLLVAGACVAVTSCWFSAQAGSLTALVGLRLLAGVAEAAVFVAAFASVADLAPPHRMGEAISYNSLALYIGLAAGPPLGELLVREGGVRAGWYGAAAAGAVAAVAFTLLRETRPPTAPRAGRTPLLHLPTVPVALGFLASAVAMGGFLAFAVLHAERVGLERTSLPLFVYGAVVVVGRIGFARVPDRLPPLPLGAAALGVMAAGLLVATSWSTPWGLLTGTALMALGVTFSTPAFFSAIFAAAGPSERGAASATASMALDIGLGLGPVALGVTADRFGIPGAFAAAAGIAVLGAGWTVRLATRKDPRP